MLGHHNMQIIVEGCLLPEAWDRAFSITALVLACDDEREFRVANLKEHRELLALCHQFIRAKGTVRTENGKELLEITAFRPLDIPKAP